RRLGRTQHSWNGPSRWPTSSSAKEGESRIPKRRLPPEEKKSDALYIRMKPSDRTLIERAVEATYGVGTAHGMTTECVTRVLTGYAKKILAKKARRLEESDGQE